MQPFITQEPFWQVDGPNGITNIPADVADMETLFPEVATTYGRKHSPHTFYTVDFYLDKFWTRFSAPGYLDCTEWEGPFDTLEEAEHNLAEQEGWDGEWDDDPEEEAQS